MLSAVLAVLAERAFLWALGASFRENAAIFRDIRPLSLWTFVPREPTMGGFA